jgi:aspartyl-tRNA(Asn)/glutamyl-tRNA(Gln) amidotransferase subunit C
MTLSVQEVKKIAKLARLNVDDNRALVLQKDLNRIFNWIEDLNEVDTTNVEPMTGVEGQQLDLRKDEVTEGNIRDELVKNAPVAKYGYFVVPKVIE